MARDVKKITSMVDIVDVINEHVPLKKRGGKHMGVCPFHDDHKSSLMVSKSKQIFKCFACGAGGDVIDFFIRLGYDFNDAINIVENRKKSDLIPKKLHIVRDRHTWTQVRYPTHFPKTIRHYEYGKPTYVWGYHNPDGKPMAYVCRFDRPDGKEIVPYVFARNDKGVMQWRWMGFERPRPMYNLHEIVNNPDKPIALVEGEKAAEAGKVLLPNMVVSCWQGGAEAVRYTDFSPLNGRTVLFIPDNDEPGYKAMSTINEMVETKESFFLDVSEKPIHWDVADEPSWTPREMRDFLKKNTRKVNELKTAA
jgi:hypothetical protein